MASNPRTTSLLLDMEPQNRFLQRFPSSVRRNLTRSAPFHTSSCLVTLASGRQRYHMAKQRQEIVRARLGQLKKRMGDLSLINLNNIPRGKASIGSIVKVYDSSKDEEIEYKLVTSEETDIAKGMISTSSPIGKALMGKKEGDTVTVVTPTGKREMDILKLLTIHDIEESEAAK